MGDLSVDLVCKVHEIMNESVAEDYRASQEKFIFCIDLLEISAHHTQADLAVEYLEYMLETYLEYSS